MRIYLRIARAGTPRSRDADPAQNTRQNTHRNIYFTKLSRRAQDLRAPFLQFRTAKKREINDGADEQSATFPRSERGAQFCAQGSFRPAAARLIFSPGACTM